VNGQVLVSIREFRFWQLAGVVVGLAVLLMALARLIWRLGVRSYSGASA
jgi:ABC-type uncharacterized transport system permease subunit